MRRLRVHAASPAEPTHRDHFAAAVRIDDAVAVAVALRGLASHPFDESLLRAMRMNVNPNATAMIMIANACFQQGLDNGLRNRALRRAVGRVLRQGYGRGQRVFHAMLSFLKVIHSRYAANSPVQPLGATSGCNLWAQPFRRSNLRTPSHRDRAVAGL